MGVHSIACLPICWAPYLIKAQCREWGEQEVFELGLKDSFGRKSGSKWDETFPGARLHLFGLTWGWNGNKKAHRIIFGGVRKLVPTTAEPLHRWCYRRAMYLVQHWWWKPQKYRMRTRSSAKPSKEWHCCQREEMFSVSVSQGARPKQLLQWLVYDGNSKSTNDH